MITLRWLPLILLLAIADVWARVGVLTEVNGEVRVLREQQVLAVAPGVDIEAEDIIETEGEASAQIELADGSMLRLGPDSRLAMSEYRLDDNKNVLAATLDLLAGWVRFTVAKLQRDASYEFTTPVLTIGVRGTEGVINADDDAGGLHLTEGVVDVKPFGVDVKTMLATRITAGEFIQRRRHQALQRLAAPPPNFQRRLPPRLEKRIVQRVELLKKRGVPPRVIRKLNREDAQRYIQRHPHMRERLQQRFSPQYRPGLRPMDKQGARPGAPGPHPRAIPKTPPWQQPPMKRDGSGPGPMVPPQRNWPRGGVDTAPMQPRFDPQTKPTMQPPALPRIDPQAKPMMQAPAPQPIAPQTKPMLQTPMPAKPPAAEAPPQTELSPNESLLQRRMMEADKPPPIPPSYQTAPMKRLP